MQPIQTDGRQELTLVERLVLATANGVGYASRCPVHHEKLHLFKLYEFENGLLTTQWYLSGRCPACSNTARVTPTPNRIPSLYD